MGKKVSARRGRGKPGTTEGTRSYWKHCAFINEALPSTTHSTSLISLRGSFLPCRYIWFIEAETEGTLKKEGHIPVPFLKAAWAENWDGSSPSFISSFSNAQPPEQLLKRLRVWGEALKNISEVSARSWRVLKTFDLTLLLHSTFTVSWYSELILSYNTCKKPSHSSS